MRIIRNIVFIGVIVLAWSVASRTTHAADLTCSGDGTWASTYSGAFAFGDGYDDDYMADLCSYIGNGSFCTDFDICGQCGYASYSGDGSCYSGTWCSGCGAGGDNSYWAEADCPCEGPLPQGLP